MTIDAWSEGDNDDDYHLDATNHFGDDDLVDDTLELDTDNELDDVDNDEDVDDDSVDEASIDDMEDPFVSDEPELDGDDPLVIDEDIPGTDPDLADADDPAFEPEFPPELNLDPHPEPVDGYPWSDAELLGNTPEPSGWNPTYTSPGIDDLQQLDASTDPIDTLKNSDDPAIASLAHWWSA